jgi:hypothetical protein
VVKVTAVCPYCHKLFILTVSGTFPGHTVGLRGGRRYTDEGAPLSTCPGAYRRPES